MSILDKLKRCSDTSKDTEPVQRQSQKPAPKSAEKLQPDCSQKQTEQEFVPTTFKRERNNKLIKVGKEMALVIDDLSTQYYVRFEDGHEEFIFKKDVKQ